MPLAWYQFLFFFLLFLSSLMRTCILIASPIKGSSLPHSICFWYRLLHWTHIQTHWEGREREEGRFIIGWRIKWYQSHMFMMRHELERKRFKNFCSNLPCGFGPVLVFAFQQSNIYLTLTADSKLLCDGYYIFQPALWCCALQTLVEILFFKVFHAKKIKKGGKSNKEYARLARYFFGAVVLVFKV